MPLMGRLVIFIYNLVLLAIASAVIAISLGWTYPLAYLNVATSTSVNQLTMGAIGIVAALIALVLLIWGLKTSPSIDAIVVDKGSNGEVSISIAAAKAIIMRAVREVEGVKELKPAVISKPEGITIKLHTMLNPDYSVPETAQVLQGVVKENLEKTGGLQVAEIKVLVDEFNAGSK